MGYFSTAYTGIHGYSIGITWLICGVIFLVIALACNKKSKKLIKKRPPCLKDCVIKPIIFLAVFFTLLAIIACGLVLGGDSEFHSRAKKVTNVIINAAENASETIYSTTKAMKEIKSYLTRVDSNSKAVESLTSTSQRLDSQASEIETQTNNNKGLINDGLNLVYNYNGDDFVDSCYCNRSTRNDVLNTVFNVLKFHRTLQVLIAFYWIFTVLSWFFFGAYFFVKNFVEDTCMAVEGFQMDPYNNSFSSILPCDQLLSEISVLTDVSKGIYELVNKVNWNISMSYGDIFHICNPFSPPPVYEYQPWDCPANSKKIGDVPRVLKQLACPDSIGGACTGGILIPENYYNTIEAYCYSIQTLLDASPAWNT
ncbi:hypothetical protein CASFOL_012415 [Castilleja foliolosa]|uniref:Uncharacterized protein n=1 Tax=Castilleja foliolosa TaxID=1961234 RepID=A0ABD3DGZ9_9LAMI